MLSDFNVYHCNSCDKEFIISEKTKVCGNCFATLNENNLVGNIQVNYAITNYRKILDIYNSSEFKPQKQEKEQYFECVDLYLMKNLHKAFSGEDFIIQGFTALFGSLNVYKLMLSDTKYLNYNNKYNKLIDAMVSSLIDGTIYYFVNRLKKSGDVGHDFVNEFKNSFTVEDVRLLSYEGYEESFFMDFKSKTTEVMNIEFTNKILADESKFNEILNELYFYIVSTCNKITI